MLHSSSSSFPQRLAIHKRATMNAKLVLRSSSQCLRQSVAPALAQRRAPLRPEHRAPPVRRGALQVVAVRVESTGLTVGFKVPDFELPEPLTGKSVRYSEYTQGSKATLVMVLSNHCPFVVHLKPAIAELASEYQGKGVAVLAISANSMETHPQDGPEKMAEDAKAQGYSFPYLFDESQAVVKSMQAACTPEFLVFDAEGGLRYHGQFDDSRPSKYGGEIPVTGEDLRHALDCTLAGQPLTRRVKNSIGCNIKWAPGNAPEWFHG